MSASDTAVLEQVLALWTAPFREEQVAAFVRRFAAAHGLVVAEDAYGNLVLRVAGSRPAKHPWVLTAHMDHPAFVVTGHRRNCVYAEFRGGVRPELFCGAAVRFDTGKPAVVGCVEHARRDAASGVFKVRLRMKGEDVPAPGTIGMWDVPPVRRRGSRIHGRACDDLAGVAAVLCVLRHAAEVAHAGHIEGLLTRAEEVGFIGAIGACCNPAQHAGLINIETSAERADARVGGGAVIRVGDATHVFDPGIAAVLSRAAATVMKAHPDLAIRRRLMDGGTCEATAFNLLGRRAGAVCLPLGNYHNHGRSGQPAAEVIDRRDFAALVALLCALAHGPEDTGDGEAALAAVRERLSARFRVMAPRLGRGGHEGKVNA